MTIRDEAVRFKRLHPLWWLAAAAIALRLLMFLGRGSYVAFDEGWYLLLGRNLLAGDGYTLSGLRHVALSPLFPVLAGSLDLLIADAVWAGRIVAAVAGGLLVIPCWTLFNRMAGRRTALIACSFITVMPSLTPFVAPYWIGWDLWVGAEPLLHLFLYSGLALVLRACDGNRPLEWLLAGVSFGLAYLARPEAIITFGVVVIAVTAFLLIAPRATRILTPVPLLLGFVFAAAPYWVYLHDATGRWTITGRDVQVTPAAARGGAAGSAARPIDRMLWADSDQYVQGLFALDSAGERLADGYWGVPLESPITVPAPAPAGEEVLERTAAPDIPGLVPLYSTALGIIAPPYIWMLAAIGLLVPRRRLRGRELLGAVPVATTSIVIAVVVAVDPRTQLLIVPLAAFYAARGARLIAWALARRLRRRGAVRRSFLTAATTVTVIALLFATDARRLFLSLSLGSPHHLVGAANRHTGEALAGVVPPAARVMSWHPAIALFARRDWQVLPRAPFDRVVRYARAVGTEYVVLSAYYPSPLSLENLPGEYLVLYVPRHLPAASGWAVEIRPGEGSLLFGELKPVGATGSSTPEEQRSN